MEENMKNYLLLQLFAEDTADISTDQTADTPEVTSEPDKQVRTYSDDDVDRIVQERLARERAKIQKEQADAAEAERFKKMNEQQKIEARMQKLEAQLNDYKRRETETQMMTVAREAITSAGVNVTDTILKALVSDKAEATKANVDSFLSAFKEAVDKQVAAKLTHAEPKKGSRPAAGLTRSQILETKDRATRQKLIAENPDLFPEMRLN